MKMKLIMLSFLVAVFLMPTGCAEKSVGSGEGSMQSQGASQLSPAEQKEQAYEIFKQILELSNSQDREQNIPEMEKLYRQIIDKYPGVGLAQESYLRLIIIAKEKKTASGDAEAERFYQEFLVKYPDSKLRKILENEARATD